MLTVALNTGWPPSEVARLTLPELQHISEALEARNG